MPAALHIKSLLPWWPVTFTPPAPPRRPCFYIASLSLNLWGEQQLPKSCRGAFHGIGDLDTVRLQLFCTHARANHTGCLSCTQVIFRMAELHPFALMRWGEPWWKMAVPKRNLLRWKIKSVLSTWRTCYVMSHNSLLKPNKQMTGKRSNKVTLSIFF